MTKQDLIRSTLIIMKTPEVEQWYKENLETKPQEQTILRLEKAIRDNNLTIEEALTIAFITGLQWEIKFKGVP